MRTPAGRRRAAAALVAGGLPVFAFPEPSWWWWAYAALVPWLLLLRSASGGRRAAFEGWLGGTGFLIAVHSWLIPNLTVFIVPLAALLGLLWAPWGLLVHRMLGGPPGPDGGRADRSGGPSATRAVAAVAVVPAGWLMIELVRSWQWLGGPWGLMGASQWQVPPALRLASAGGVWLVSLLVVAVNTAIVVLITVPRARWATAGTVALGALVTASLVAWAPRPHPAGRARIAVVQPGVIQDAGARLAREERLTRELSGRPAGQRLDLVMWGESSIGEDPYGNPALTAGLAALSRGAGADLLVNADARRSGSRGIYKSAVLVGPHGLTGQRYDKMRLVPFGEYIPFRSVLGWATSVGRAARIDRRHGNHPVVMVLPPGTDGAGRLRVGPLICFETAFPDMSRTLVRRGARVLAAQSSTSTFQDSWAPAQHASLAALRAAETGRPMVHATLTGISAAYGPDGARSGPRLPVSASTAVVYDVPLATGTTLFVRYGDWAVYASAGVLVLLAGALGVRRFSRPVRGPGGRPARTARGSAARPGR
ncbi:apolipoprotein N-acyltransferase [Streptomyces qinzhouensis]|uniref:Apolipoprotein N-acyltransferase n=1 Tax=Streptomyces qinzhouensis TaxID=2599401 RepID=A0A5B8ICU1_9ACTN|nr:apolipoprotein N-acyltransferase [Streptomyces qinzhouensis]QDY75732.1 apolipoprotein N-acyltransferase [Streptomyces qinzhouensis]